MEFGVADLSERLATLLEQYLDTLHQYQQVREELSSSLATGFFSLARANFNNSSGTRYGQDHYDERMEASRVVHTSMSDFRLSFAISKVATPLPAVEAAAPDEQQQGTSAGLPADTTASQVSPNGTVVEKRIPEPTKLKPVDPIRWFGILVPSALRISQSHFTSVIDGPIPKLAMLSNSLRNLEIEIGRTRKRLKKAKPER